jgi:hypothetical protein
MSAMSGVGVSQMGQNYFSLSEYGEEKGSELFVVSTSCDILQDFRQSAVKSSQWSITSV